MNTLLVLACLGACLLVAINQLRLAHRIEDDLAPAINQCDEDLTRLEESLADDEGPRVSTAEFLESVAQTRLKTQR